MPGIKQALLGSAVAAAIACAPMAPAAAGVHGVGPLHPFGLGRGLVGAALSLATLPIVIASAALSAAASDGPQAPAYGGAPPAYAPGYAAAPVYAPPPAYYPAPRTYYAPAPAYYPRAPVYYPQPRAYYPAPRAAAYAPRTNSVPRAGYYGANRGRASYGSGGYAYAHR
jgi:hypothetical protein